MSAPRTPSGAPEPDVTSMRNPTRPCLMTEPEQLVIRPEVIPSQKEAADAHQ